ncbi:MAG: ligase-associated DNA damage response endonuclease PdeM [Pseudomonadota bacterium]
MKEFTRESLAVCCSGEQLLLHPSKVALWAVKKTLLVADVHVGKEHTFARAGIPVPAGISEHTLNTLIHAVDSSAAERLIILGDLLHATPGRSESWQAHFNAQLATRRNLHVQVIIGNHDSKTARDRVVADLNWQQSLHEPPFVFTHEPHHDQRGHVVAGHIHPVYKLTAGRRRLRAPVFWCRQHYTVMPAFGKFTGGHLIEPDTDDRIFMIGDEQVIEV